MKSVAQRRSLWLLMTVQDRRAFVVVANVLLFLALLILCLQSGLLKRALELVVPVQLLSEFIKPPVQAPAPLIVVKPRGDKAVRYEYVATLTTSAQRAGLRKVGFVT